MWMLEGIHSYRKSGKMRKPTFEKLVKWFVQVWKEISVQTIVLGFTHAEIIFSNSEI